MVLAVIALLGVVSQAAQPPGGTLTGRVVDEVTRSPVAGATVTLVPASRRERPPFVRIVTAVDNLAERLESRR